MNVAITVGLINFTSRLNEVPRDQPVNVNLDLESVPITIKINDVPIPLQLKKNDTKIASEPKKLEKATKVPRVPNYLRSGTEEEEKQMNEMVFINISGKHPTYASLAKKFGVTRLFLKHISAWIGHANTIEQIEHWIKTIKQAEDDCPTPRAPAATTA